MPSLERQPPLASGTYTVTAGNSGGSDTATITIVVNGVAPSSLPTARTRLPDQGYHHDHRDTNLKRWPLTSWSTPSLPSGLSLDASTGAISRPQRHHGSAAYTVTATNTGGSDDTLTIEVNGVPVNSSAYNPTSFTLTKGTAMTTVTPTASGGPVTAWSVSPSLLQVFP